MKSVFNIAKSAFTLALGTIALSACSEDALDEINKNTDNALDVESKFIIADLCTNTAQYLVGGDFNTYGGTYCEQWVGCYNQLWNAEMRAQEIRSAATFNNVWLNCYTNLRNAKIVVAKCSEEGSESANLLAKGIGEVFQALTAGITTDMFGDVPYSQAADFQNYRQPKVDSQESIYADIFKLLDQAIVDLGNASGNTVSDYDMIYHGNSASWLKFAYGLKARYKLHTLFRASDKNALLNEVIACAEKSFTSAADQAQFDIYGGAQWNPVFDFQYSRDYFASSQSMYDKLAARKDPRADRVYTPPYEDMITGAEAKESGLLAANGAITQEQYVYGYDIFCYAQNAPVHLLSYHEVQFILAEAYARKGDKAKAEEILKKAIAAAFANHEVSVNGALKSEELAGTFNPAIADCALTSADAEAYYNGSIKALFDADPLKEVMIQKYIAFWNANGESTETWNDVRRMKALGQDVYEFQNPKADLFPLRAPYGNDDVTNNPNVKANYEKGGVAGVYVTKENVWWAGGSY